ncbi:MAG: SpoIVB peptidase [Clostridiales bacterium]|nr:SpoIVB peptidase [Clostridiales bacterium]
MSKVRTKKKHILRKLFILLSILGVMGAFIYVYIRLDRAIPDNIRITLNKDEEFNFKLPMEGEVKSATGSLGVNDMTVPANEIKLDLRDPFTLKATELGNYQIDLKLFGFLNFKQVNVDVIDNIELIPAGNTIGIYIETDGVMVLGTGVIKGQDGLNHEPALNKIRTGDYIVAVNGKNIKHKEELVDAIKDSNGKTLAVKIRRNKEYLEYKITPVKSETGEYKIGIWIRDDTQGIGTMTFTTKDGEFGALGHGITDVDTSQIVEVGSGNIYNAEVMTIVKGKEGDPGELIGVINQESHNLIGDISKNTPQGIFGKVNKKFEQDYNKSLPIGLKQDVRKGRAYILCCVDNNIEAYEILIEDITLGGTNNNKGLVIKITDKKLLEKTGGIVQGMSGSPIIQDNKIVGAVTHVFIQDSTKGYGTFIENMLFNIE